MSKINLDVQLNDNLVFLFNKLFALSFQIEIMRLITTDKFSDLATSSIGHDEHRSIHFMIGAKLHPSKINLEFFIRKLNIIKILLLPPINLICACQNLGHGQPIILLCHANLLYIYIILY